MDFNNSGARLAFDVTAPDVFAFASVPDFHPFAGKTTSTAHGKAAKRTSVVLVTLSRQAIVHNTSKSNEWTQIYCIYPNHLFRNTIKNRWAL